MNSLLARLLAWLLAAVAIGASAGGWWMYRSLLAEADTFFDRQLEQTALALRHQAFEFAVVPRLVEPQSDYDFVVQVWSADGLRVYQSQPHTVLPGITQLGLSTVETRAGLWRVYGVPARGFLIQVAQPVADRQVRAARLALHALTPYLFLVPVLLILATVAVVLSLRSLRQVADRVRSRPATVLEPIPETPLPEEIRPLATAFNDLLARLAAAREREQAFLSDAAHELRTPLTALRLQLDALLGASDERERTRAAQALQDGLARAARLVEQLLTLTRQEGARVSEVVDVALDALARSVIEELLPLADARHIDLGIANAAGANAAGANTAPGPATTGLPSLAVRGDADALRAMLRNLVDNAVRYTPGGGRVDVSWRSDGGHAVLSVCDTGPGIAPAEYARVFERFYRVPGSGGVGSGLGLAIVRSIAEAHSAEVRIEAGEGGRGTCVSVRFGAGARAP